MEFHFTLQYDLDNTKYQSIESLPSLLEFKTMVWLPHILTRTILESKEQGCQVNVRLDKSRKLFIKVSTPTSFLCYCSYALKQNIPIWPDYAVGLISLVWFAFIVWVRHTMVPPKTTTAHIQAAFLWVFEHSRVSCARMHRPWPMKAMSHCDSKRQCAFWIGQFH